MTVSLSKLPNAPFGTRPAWSRRLACPAVDSRRWPEAGRRTAVGGLLLDHAVPIKAKVGLVTGCAMECCDRALADIPLGAGGTIIHIERERLAERATSIRRSQYAAPGSISRTRVRSTGSDGELFGRFQSSSGRELPYRCTSCCPLSFGGRCSLALDRVRVDAVRLLRTGRERRGGRPAATHHGRAGRSRGSPAGGMSDGA